MAKTKKRIIIRKPKLTLAKVEKQVQKLIHAPEMKFYNNYITLVGNPLASTAQGYSCFQNAGTGAALVPAQGTTVNSRVGNVISVKKLHFTLAMYSPQGIAVGGGNVYGYNAVAAQQPTPAVGLVTAIYDPTGSRGQFRILCVKIKGDVGALTPPNTNAQRFLDRIAGVTFPTYLRDLDQCPHEQFQVLLDQTFEASNGMASAGSIIKHWTHSFGKYGHKVRYNVTDGLIENGDIQVYIYTDILNNPNAYLCYPQVQIEYTDA